MSERRVGHVYSPRRTAECLFCYANDNRTIDTELFEAHQTCKTSVMLTANGAQALDAHSRRAAIALYLRAIYPSAAPSAHSPLVFAHLDYFYHCSRERPALTPEHGARCVWTNRSNPPPPLPFIPPGYFFSTESAVSRDSRAPFC